MMALLPSLLSRALMLRTQSKSLAHELAHVAVGVEHDHDEVWQEAFDKIFEEYNRIGKPDVPRRGGQCDGRPR